MAKLTIALPSLRTSIKILFVLLVLGGFGASGTLIGLAFWEIQQLHDLTAEARGRVHQLETQPPTPQPTASPVTIPTPQPTSTPQLAPTPQPTATPTRIRIPPSPTPTRIRIPPTPTPIPTWNDVYNEVRRSVVWVVSPTGSGTGWVYERGWILTAAHVVEQHRTVTIRYEDARGQEREVEGRVAGTDQLRDLTAIAITGTDLNPIYGRRNPYTEDAGLPVMSVGFSSSPPVGWPNIRVGAMTTMGIYSGLDDLEAIETDATFDPGDSGGPIFDKNGDVIGIAQASRITTGDQRVQGRQRGVSIREVVKVWPQLKRGAHLNADSDYWFYRAR